MRQSGTAVGSTTITPEVGMDVICIDRITRSQDFELLISIIMTRCIALKGHRLLQHYAVRACGQRRFVVVVEGYFVRHRFLLLSQQFYAATEPAIGSAC